MGLPERMAGAATEPLPLGGVAGGADGPFGRLFLVEFEANQERLRTREDMAPGKR
jgi:hypothetical protein